jgi:glycerate kinase
MSRRILIAPDKFKGTLTAREAAEAIARGWARVHPLDVLVTVPVSDGGDGFGSVLAAAVEGGERETSTVDAAHRPRRAPWWWSEGRSVAVVETAQVVGLALLPPRAFHPFALDTFGIGAVLQDAVDAGARECWVGIGGSATNDGGFGLARSMGWEFLDASGQAIGRWTDLGRLHAVRRPTSARLAGCRVTVAVDVDNPLMGPLGCSRVYGPQKGLRLEDMALAEEALGRLAEVMAAELGTDLATLPGSGAAGGLGFALRAFLGARAESGFEMVARAVGLDAHLASCDLVLTGEGSLDRQSLMGKGTGRLAARARAAGRRCIGLAGRVEPVSAEEKAASPFDEAWGVAPALASVEEAMGRPAHWLEQLAAVVARRS